MMKPAEYWVDKLDMIAHPEGGYYKQTYRSDQTINLSDGRQRHYYTSIYFLLTDVSPSHFHRLKSDEIWYYHAGSALSVHVIYPDGRYEEIRLGLDLDNGEVCQARVPEGTIFGSSVAQSQGYALVSCMVSPGFDFNDFELFTQAQLIALYPQHQAIIRQLAYEVLPD